MQTETKFKLKLHVLNDEQLDYQDKEFKELKNGFSPDYFDTIKEAIKEARSLTENFDIGVYEYNENYDADGEFEDGIDTLILTI